MRFFDSTDRGLWTAFLIVFLISGLLDIFGPALRPSEELLRTLAGIGASFFLAFIIEATWMATRPQLKTAGERLLGVLSGFAMAGLLGVVLILVASDHPPDDRNGPIGEFGLWWAIVALGMLGLMVAAQPLLAHSWGDEGGADPAD